MSVHLLLMSAVIMGDLQGGGGANSVCDRLFLLVIRMALLLTSWISLMFRKLSVNNTNMQTCFYLVLCWQFVN